MFKKLNTLLTKIIARHLATPDGSVTIRLMYATDTIFTCTFPIGNIGGTRIRVSYLFPIFALAVAWRLENLVVAGMATGILLASVLIHELMHLLLVRSTSGDIEEFQLWPLGGLSEPNGRREMHNHVNTMMAGPITNLLVALSCLLVLDADYIIPLLNPFATFVVPNGEALVTTAWRLTFSCNLILFAANMIPITPFDNGVLLRTYLTTRFTESESRDLMIRLGLVTAIFGLLSGFVFNISALIVVSAFVLVLQIHDNIRWYEVQSAELSQYEYVREDGSEEWADAEFSEFGFEEPSDDVIDRWREDREAEKQRQEQEEKRQEEAEVDEILLKLHQHGREGLSLREIHALNRMSARYRERGQHN